MVQKGQFLERPTLIPVGDHVLEGMSHRGARRPPLLILPPRPDEGGGMDHVVAAELAWAAATAGHPTLRFNHRGVGASQGARGSHAELVDDAEAALFLLSENTDTRAVALVALGGSARVALSLLTRHPTLAGVSFVSPDGLPAEQLRALATPPLIVAARGASPDRAALSQATLEAGGTYELFDDEDATFRRDLPRVGRAVARWLSLLSGS